MTDGAHGAAARSVGIFEASGLGEAMAYVGLALVEIGAFSVRIAGGTHPILELLGIHLLVVAALAGLVALARQSRRDVTYSMIALVGGAAIGPVGILGAAALALMGRRSAMPTALVTQWYDRIALSTTVTPEERLCEDVRVGRTLDLEAAPPTSFPAVIASGTLAERQAILSHIARHFHPAYLPTLTIALASTEPLVRVQAAAVASHIAPKVREQFLQCEREGMQVLSDPLRALSLLGEVEALIQCCLLDEADRRNAERLAEGLADGLIAINVRKPLALPYTSDTALAEELDAHLERLLLARRRYADLRVHRTARQLLRRHAKARLRRLAAPPRRLEVGE